MIPSTTARWTAVWANEEFKEFVVAAHARSQHVIVDGVFSRD